LDDDFPKYKTHFTELHIPDEVEEEPRWVVKKREDSYFKSFTGIDFRSSSAAYEDYAYSFTDKSKAEAVATLIDGSVEEV
ncbi:hypothetical protein P7D93_20170, partial [Enterococcus raffinosus]|nr:hypothetical protein [Enterococcus raffinosus]